MNPTTIPAEDARVRALAEAMDCFTVSDICTLYGITETTAESWRKHGRGPAHIQAANRPLYPRDEVKADLAARRRQRSNLSAKSQL